MTVPLGQPDVAGHRDGPDGVPRLVTVGTAPERETPDLVNRVREARLNASRARQEANRILARVSRTAVMVAGTRQRTTRARDLRRRLTEGRSAGMARDARLSAAPRVLPGSTPPSLVPDSTLPDPVIRPWPDSSPATLRRAVAFIEEHADRDLTVADIAAASYVTTRAVQLAFRRHLNLTPMEYLRRVRLERAHRDLLAADPARESVTSVAYRWRFGSASRFASYYRDAYGVLPSRTLHG